MDAKGAKLIAYMSKLALMGYAYKICMNADGPGPFKVLSIGALIFMLPISTLT